MREEVKGSVERHTIHDGGDNMPPHFDTIAQHRIHTDGIVRDRKGVGLRCDEERTAKIVVCAIQNGHQRRNEVVSIVPEGSGDDRASDSRNRIGIGPIEWLPCGPGHGDAEIRSIDLINYRRREQEMRVAAAKISSAWRLQYVKEFGCGHVTRPTRAKS